MIYQDQPFEKRRERGSRIFIVLGRRLCLCTDVGRCQRKSRLCPSLPCIPVSLSTVNPGLTTFTIYVFLRRVRGLHFAYHPQRILQEDFRKVFDVGNALYSRGISSVKWSACMHFICLQSFLSFTHLNQYLSYLGDPLKTVLSIVESLVRGVCEQADLDTQNHGRHGLPSSSCQCPSLLLIIVARFFPSASCQSLRKIFCIGFSPTRHVPVFLVLSLAALRTCFAFWVLLHCSALHSGRCLVPCLRAGSGFERSLFFVMMFEAMFTS